MVEGTPSRIGDDGRSRRAALRLAVVYGVVAGAWILFSDRALEGIGFPEDVESFVGSVKGGFFVAVTALMLYSLALRHLSQLHTARDELARQEERIRQAYVDVIDAVTGGRLVLMTDRELDSTLGIPVSPEWEISEPGQLGGARERVRDAVSEVSPELANSCALLNPLGEALNNVLKHVGRGTYRVYSAPGCVRVAISDSGPGIDFRTLPKATLVPGFSTTATLGMGFTIMLQLTDRVLLSTHPGRTTVVLELDVPA